MGYSLNRLQAGRVPFDLGDGITVYFRGKKEFDLQEYAAWQRLNKRFRDIAKQRAAARGEEQAARVEQRNLTLCQEMIALVLPDFPSDAMAGLTPGQLDNLAGICINVASGTYAEGAPDDEDVTAVKDLYPELSHDFVHTLRRFQVEMLLPEPEPAGN